MNLSAGSNLPRVGARCNGSILPDDRYRPQTRPSTIGNFSMERIPLVYDSCTPGFTA